MPHVEASRDSSKNFILKKELYPRLIEKQTQIQEWLGHYLEQAAPPFYCSIDLRDSAYKIVPVDSNVYPAGFNNICPDDLVVAPSLIRKAVDQAARSRGLPAVKKILVLPESHTSNHYYIQNIKTLLHLTNVAGFEVCLGWMEPGQSPITLAAQDGSTLRAFPFELNGGKLSVKQDGVDFVPDVILLNNDFSSGYPEILDDVKQPILPCHQYGWHTRRKIHFFDTYNKLAQEFAGIVSLDPWHFQIDTRSVNGVNFNEDVGIENVAQVTDEQLQTLREQYTQRGISTSPFVFVKNSAGTYGMGVFVTHSGDEVRQVNRREKNKMSFGKNKLPIDSVIVQEGIPTVLHVEGLVSEPVIYLIGEELLGGFYRANELKSDSDNLNSKGMVFKKFCMSDLHRPASYGPVPTDELVYGTIAKISAVATGLELKQNYNPCGDRYYAQ